MIWNHKWRDYGLQKVKVTDTRHYTESERFNINLQVANYWLLEMKSLNYEEVFFVELKWIFWNSTLRTKHQGCLPFLCRIHKKYCFLQNILRPNFVPSRLVTPFSEHLTTRNIRSVFRTSYYQKYLLLTLLIIMY